MNGIGEKAEQFAQTPSRKGTQLEMCAGTKSCKRRVVSVRETLEMDDHIFRGGGVLIV